MANTRCKLFRIKALSNMHVGSGDSNFGIVDNLVQKDVISDIPTIHSSSLKGALREFFVNELQEHNLVRSVFGPGPKEKQGEKNAKGGGMYRFFSAKLLSIPARSNKRPFFRAVSPYILNDFLADIEMFQIEFPLKDKLRELAAISPNKGRPLIFDIELQDALIEDMQAEHKSFDTGVLEPILGENIAMFHNDDLKKHCKNLPVIPRNYLENGKSQNLWYEEVVPRQSLFYAIIAVPEPDSEDVKKIDEKFFNELKNNIIQIGGNATIGYGFTKIDQIN